MCWHEPEQIRIFLLLPGYDAPLTHIQSTIQYCTHFLHRNVPACTRQKQIESRMNSGVTFYPPQIMYDATSGITYLQERYHRTNYCGNAHVIYFLHASHVKSQKSV